MLLMRLFGWKVDRHLPEGVSRCVMVAAPHTSNWDAFFMIVTGLALGLRFRFAIKKEWLRFPMGLLLKPLGAIGIDRSSKQVGGARISQVDAMAALFEGRDQLSLIIAPEGSRALADRWRTGFYQVALKAGVPITLGYLDYGRKLAGVGPAIQPSGDLEADMAIIHSFYRDITPCIPERSLVYQAQGVDPQKAPQETKLKDPS